MPESSPSVRRGADAAAVPPAHASAAGIRRRQAPEAGGRRLDGGTAGASDAGSAGRGPGDADAKEGEIVAHAEQPAEEAQKTFFRVTDNVPEEAWYWAALGSIGVSAMLKLSGKDGWAIFVGQWPPTFLLFGLYHRLIRPSRQ